MTAIERELLAALEDVTDGFEKCMIHVGSDAEFAAIRVRKARAAIAKAKGESE